MRKEGDLPPLCDVHAYVRLTLHLARGLRTGKEKNAMVDARTFDRLTVAMTQRPTRRAALQLLAGGVLTGLLSPRLARAAQRSDRDGDGLFDDDETNVYGTNPDVFDTDGDGVGDGEEIYLGTNPFDGGVNNGTGPLNPGGDAGAPGGQDINICAQVGQSCAVANCCVGFCDQDDICECVPDGGECAQTGTGGCCSGLPCNANGFCGACTLFGGACNADAECCSGGQYGAGLCCAGVCTDVTNIGFVCPGAPVASGTCTSNLGCGSDANGECFCDLNATTGTRVCNKNRQAAGPFTSCAECPAGTNCFDDELYGFYCFKPCGAA